MRLRGGVVLAWGSAVAALVGFLLPWARFAVKESHPRRITLEVRQGGRTVSADLADWSRLPRVVRGIDIPTLARDPNTQVAAMAVELLTGRRQHAEAKSLAVYLAPGLAAIGALALTFAGHRRPVAIATAAFCALIAAWGAYKLTTIRTGLAAITVAAASGVWISVGAYAGLAVAAVMLSVDARREAS